MFKISITGIRRCFLLFFFIIVEKSSLMDNLIFARLEETRPKNGCLNFHNLIQSYWTELLDYLLYLDN